MTSIVLNRLRNLRPKPKVVFSRAPESLPPPPISSEELESMILNEINPPTEKPVEPSTEELLAFDGLSCFVDWFKKHKDKFDAPQTSALGTLENAYNSTLGGCKCTSRKRSLRADEYFHLFWTNNKASDLVPKIKEIAQVKKLRISVRGILIFEF